MNEVENQDQYDRIYTRDRGICQTCGEPVTYGVGQRAHLIAQSKANRKRYSDAVIYHDRNMVLTCPGACNDAQNLGFKSALSDAFAREIRRTIYTVAILNIEAMPDKHTDILNRLGEVAS